MFGQFGIVQPVDFDAFGDLVAVGAVHQLEPVAQDVITADKIATDTDGPRGRRHVYGQIFLNFVNDFKVRRGFPDPSCYRRSGSAGRAGGRPRTAFGSGFHPFGPVDHHDGGIHGSEGAIGVFGEIRVAGRVHQIEAEVFEIK